MDSLSMFAYLDPGSGSYVLQLLLATAFGAAFGLRLFWRQTRLFLAGVRVRGRKS